MTIHSAADQRTRLLTHLKKHGSATTTEIRHTLDILMPAARIFELRHEQNYNIVRVWDITENPGGSNHRVARYVLKAGKYMEAA